MVYICIFHHIMPLSRFDANGYGGSFNFFQKIFMLVILFNHRKAFGTIFQKKIKMPRYAVMITANRG